MSEAVHLQTVDLFQLNVQFEVSVYSLNQVHFGLPFSCCNLFFVVNNATYAKCLTVSLFPKVLLLTPVYYVVQSVKVASMVPVTAKGIHQCHVLCSTNLTYVGYGQYGYLATTLFCQKVLCNANRQECTHLHATVCVWKHHLWGLGCSALHVCTM